jgi:osmotically-inducible protein OsmY
MMDRKRHQLSCDVMEAAKCRLQERLDTDARKVSCEYENGVLVLHGRVSSFYYKQLAQEAVAGLPSVVEVINQIEVVASTT